MSRLFRSRIKKKLRRIVYYPTPLLLVSILLLFSVIEPRFLSAQNIRNILEQNYYRIVVMMGVAVIMEGGQLDFSIGFQVSLISIIISKCLSSGIALPLIFVVAGLTGILCGAINGTIVAYLKLPSYVVTVVTGLLFKGCAAVISNGITLFNLSSAIRALCDQKIFGFLSISFLITLFSVIVVGVLMRTTTLGMHIIALGENESFLWSAKINACNVKIKVFMIGSFFYSIAALLLVARQGAASVSIGDNLEIESLIIAYIAGYCPPTVNNYIRRSPPILSSCYAVWIFVSVQNGLQIIGSNSNMQDIILFVTVCISFFLIKIASRISKAADEKIS